MNEQHLYALSSIREFEHDGDNNDRLYIPGRGLVLGLEKPGSLVVLPDTSEVRRFTADFGQILMSLGVEPSRPVYIPDDHYLLDQNILTYEEILKNELVRDVAYRVFPYTNTGELRQWLMALNRQGYQVQTDMPERVYFENPDHPQHRGGWSRNVRDPGAMSFPESYGINYPVAWRGASLPEVMEAYERVAADTGNNRAIVKPVFSSGGFTLQRVESLPEVCDFYNSLAASGVLDLFGQAMPVEVQAFVDIEEIFSIQYAGTANISPNGLTRQMEQGNRWIGNIFNSNHIAPWVRQEAAGIFGRFVHGMEAYTGQPMRGYGGLDLARIHIRGREEVTVLEHNGGREVGARPGIVLAHALGIDDRPYMLRKVPAEPTSGLEPVWRMLQSEGLAYDPQAKRGVLPLLWLSGNVFLFAAGEDVRNHHNLEQMADAAINTACRHGFLENIVY